MCILKLYTLSLSLHVLARTVVSRRGEEILLRFEIFPQNLSDDSVLPSQRQMFDILGNAFKKYIHVGIHFHIFTFNNKEETVTSD